MVNGCVNNVVVIGLFLVSVLLMDYGNALHLSLHSLVAAAASGMLQSVTLPLQNSPKRCVRFALKSSL